MRKTFTDYLDDVSTTYPGKEVLIPEYGNESFEMSDGFWRGNDITEHISGSDRGDPDKKDWYSFVGITLSFKLNNQTKGCDY